MIATPGIARGCGTARTEGGVYIESGLSSGADAKELEWFLTDPPRPFQVDHKLGVELIEGPDGRTHILDWVGMKHYPYAADILEEGRRFGFSRRVAKNIDFTRLTLGSRILLVHARGLLKNAAAIRPFCPDGITAPGARPADHHCTVLYRNPKDTSHWNPDYTGACSRDHWMHPEVTNLMARDKNKSYRHFHDGDTLKPGEIIKHFRKHAATSYEVFPPALDAPEPEWEPALIASIPITNITVIRARDGSHQQTTDTLRKLLTGPDGLRIQLTEQDE